MKNKFKIIILAVASIICLISILLYNYYPRITYDLNEKTDTYYVTKVYGTNKSWSIPSKYNGKLVEGISPRAFYQNEYVEEVILPDTVKYIERLAFSECKNLKKINLNYVLEIERNAFTYCESLTSLDIYAKNIGASAFYGCISITKIILHDGLETIGSMAFAYTKIKVLDIPESTKEIYTNCFKYCNELEVINIYGEKLKGNIYLKSLDIVNFME